MRDLNRLLRARSVAVVGGGTWCANVMSACAAFGFSGEIWPVHPERREIGGRRAFADIAALPGAPDASFIGVNRNATIEVVRALAARDAGGAVCFASGFSEAAAEDAGAGDLQAALVAAAGEMPILGPNCYGFVNALDRSLLWPDEHGCVPVDRGVALLTQSSNIAINLTMQQRALPIAYAITCGNMAQTSQAQIARALLDDDRVTAIGLHVEGFGDVAEWEALAEAAHAKGVPLVVLKVGVSEQAQAATISHTASLAGSDAGAQALLERLGIARVASPAILLETLKLFHVAGSLTGNRLSSISCSGGEASLVADMAAGRGVVFPPLAKAQTGALREALGPMVALSNPLDYHTYIWGDVPRMTEAWAAMSAPGVDLTLSVVDYPTTDDSAWRCTVEAALNAQAQTGRPFAVVSSLPELMPADIAWELSAGGVVPLHGLDEALGAAEAASRIGAPNSEPVLVPVPPAAPRAWTEAEGKAALGAHGLDIPAQARAGSAAEAAQAAQRIGFPVVLKGEGIAHKTEAGAVALNLADARTVQARAEAMPSTTFLIEEMITEGVAELLVGVTLDPAHGYVLTLAAGGTLTELMQDSQSLLVPARPDAIRAALGKLRIAPLIAGYRGAPGGDMDALLAAIMAIQDYVIAQHGHVAEIEVNPLILTPTRAVAADVLIRAS